MTKGVGRKFFRGGRPTEKKDRTKISKKRPKNSTFKPLSTIFVPCLKILPPPPAADAHGNDVITTVYFKV